MTPKLNIDKSSCFIGNTEIKVGQSIDYESANTNAKPSMGKIVEFKYPGFMQSDKSSVWMLVKDLQEEKESEWISVHNWANKYIPKENGSKEPEIVPDLPF